jgi:hypothetical protein
MVMVNVRLRLIVKETIPIPNAFPKLIAHASAAKNVAPDPNPTQKYSSIMREGDVVTDMRRYPMDVKRPPMNAVNAGPMLSNNGPENMVSCKPATPTPVSMDI